MLRLHVSIHCALRRAHMARLGPWSVSSIYHIPFPQQGDLFGSGGVEMPSAQKLGSVPIPSLALRRMRVQTHTPKVTGGEMPAPCPILRWCLMKCSKCSLWVTLRWGIILLKCLRPHTQQHLVMLMFRVILLKCSESAVSFSAYLEFILLLRFVSCC